MLLLQIFLVAVACVTSSVSLNSKINPSLENTLKSKSSVDISVFFGPYTSVLNDLKTRTFGGRAERIRSVKSTLSAAAAESQKPILEYLAKKTSSEKSNLVYKNFWISNTIIIENADQGLVERLAAFKGVRVISEAKPVKLVQPVNIKESSNPRILEENSEVSFGVFAIGAERAWAFGYDGEGIIIGNIDTGARGTHEALRDNFAEGGWYDPIDGNTEPYDPNGHGTHTVGTMVGRNGIGVAPGATWMSCRAFDETGGATFSHVYSCFEFMSCPNPTGDEACSKAPHILSNSWSSQGENGQTTYFDAIETLHSMEIIPVFASGNSAVTQTCGSTDSPGDGHALSVGSISNENVLSAFSNIGPGGFEAFGPKPDLVAPGQAVRSASNLGDSKYADGQGTSMATPHVSGAIALLLQKNGELTYEEVKAALIAGANKEVFVESLLNTCGGINQTQVPNHFFGHGRLNIFESLGLGAASSQLAPKLLLFFSFYVGLRSFY